MLRKKEIEADITRCESYDEISGSESLYGILVAKYSVLDPQFSKGLSTNGKATALGSEFDFRQELRAIAAKLRMWLLTASHEGEAESLPMSPKDKVNDFIRRGNDIKATEFHPAQGGFPFSYVGGPKFDIWMSDINIFNERYLKSHPLHIAFTQLSFIATNSHRLVMICLAFYKRYTRMTSFGIAKQQEIRVH